MVDSINCYLSSSANVASLTFVTIRYRKERNWFYFAVNSKYFPTLTAFQSYFNLEFGLFITMFFYHTFPLYSLLSHEKFHFRITQVYLVISCISIKCLKLHQFLSFWDPDLFGKIIIKLIIFSMIWIDHWLDRNVCESEIPTIRTNKTVYLRGNLWRNE